MNYSGNMPDWHQYNPPQSGINDITSNSQNVNSGHLPFISSISPTQLNGLNLSSEGHEKRQNDSNFNPRHFQPHVSNNMSHGHSVADNTPLASMVQMQNCIGHYGPSNTRNPMVDNLNGPMDQRNAAIGSLNDELGYRNNQVPLNGPISHLNGPNVINMNTSHGSIPRNTNMNIHSTNRTGLSSFMPCKGLCCNPDPNMGYQQWEKYCSYQNNTAYRENIRTSGYQTDTRRYGTDYNFRKDNFDGKEVLPPPIVPNAPNVDHRRNFPDFKYRKDRVLPRSYPSSSGMSGMNYPMQNYNYTAGEFQKYHYNVKEYSKVNNMNMPNQGMVKHQQEQGFMAQQKYNNKQTPYQNSTMMSSGMPSTNINPNMIASTQNTYFNPQYPRNLPNETSHECQETSDNVSMMNKMQTSQTLHNRYQIYQQKMAMQKFSLENYLKDLAKIPGYQSHPKYKEGVLRYRELQLKMQQSVSYQGQMQQTPCMTTASAVNTSSVPPINLQFDQNGVLINSNYIAETFPRVQQTLHSQVPMDNMVDKQNKQEGNNISEMASHNIQKPEQLVSQQHDGHSATLCSEDLQKQDRYTMQKNLDQSQFEVQKRNENFTNNPNININDTTIQQKISKEFADKPELDVRQFLANWDESEDEDGASSNIPNIVLSDSTPVVVVGYENVDLSAKTLQSLDSSKQEEISANVITFENRDKNAANVVTAQDCLTISYASAENVDIAKDACEKVTKESIVQPGSIIQCISNGPNEVPTIHIVDNLEIGSILQVTSGQIAETLKRQDAVPFFHESKEGEVSTINLENNKFEKSDGNSESVTEYRADLENLNKEKYIVENSSPPKTVENTSQTSLVVDRQELTTLSTPTKINLESGQDINLKKQNSFTSEESHNPDDISLPDLPTSECTPISTTLNTPIHSDSEESSERVEDLTISTNPIEVIQNSPIISFTQSPTRGEPYDHLNDEGIVKNKSTSSLETRYQNRFKESDDNNMLGHDTVLGAFECTASIDKNECTAKNGECSNSNESIVTSTSNVKVFSNSKTENVEVTGTRIALTSGEYELKIVSTDMQNRSARNYKNTTTERHMNESQIAVCAHDTQATRKKLQVSSETNVKAAHQHDDTMELDKTLRSATNDSDSVERREDENNINYTETYVEARSSKTSQNEEKLSDIETKGISTESTNQIGTNTINLSPTNDTTSKSLRTTVEESCSTKIIKYVPSTSHSTNNTTLSSNRLSTKSENFTSDKSAKETSLERNVNGNESLKVDTKDLRNSRHANHKISTSNEETNSRDERSESIAEKCDEIITYHDKQAQEITTHRVGSCTIGNLKESDVSQNKLRIIDNVVDNSKERLRLLKQYRKIKYKLSDVEEDRDKSRDMQRISDYKADKKYHFSSNLDEQFASQIANDEQKDARFKSTEEQERKHAILKTFVNKNINPDFAIQVTNVNFKRKDNGHQKELQHSGEEERKNSGSLDGIKIEINVSCTERNTTEKLLHENIKNAVAETIGHLTNSISNGARSNSSGLTEVQCDKKIICDRMDSHDYERCNSRSPSASIEISAHNEIKDNKEVMKSDIAACKESAKNNETSTSLVSKKKRSSSLSDRELVDNIYENDGLSSLKIVANTCARSSSFDATIIQDDVFSVNTNIIDTEPTPSAVDASKSELIKRRSIHQDMDREIVTNDFCASEDSKISSDNLLYLESKNVRRKKEHQETTVLYKNVRNLQNNKNSNMGASTSSNTVDFALENPGYNDSTYFDYNHFDVAPNENADLDDRHIERKRSKRNDNKFNDFDLYESSNGYVNPTFFSANLENLNTVPVRTTKDGKITYSPNPRFTYRELIMEGRMKKNCSNKRESYFMRSPSYDYYNCSKLRKLFKRNRDVTTADIKREVDSVDIKPSQSVTRHVDYTTSKNIIYKSVSKSRNTPYLEFFNDDANRLYTNGNDNQQPDKESNKKSVDMNFLEKQSKLDIKSDSKHGKTKIFADGPNCEKGYNDSSLFVSNLLLESKAGPCWEETMESVKSYSSHVDRRKSNNSKELNFSEIFSVQKRSDSFSSTFLSTERKSSNNNGDSETNNKNNTANESISSRPTYGCIDDLRLIQEGSLSYEQSDTVRNDKQENENDNDNRNETTATLDVDNKSAGMHNVSLCNEYAKREQTETDEIESSAIPFIEKTQSCSPEQTNQIIHVLEKDQHCTEYTETERSGNGVKDDEVLMECLAEDDKDVRYTVSSNIDKYQIEDTKQNLDKNPVEIADSESNANSKNLPDEVERVETLKESPAFVSNQETDEIDDSAKNNSSFAESDNVVSFRPISSISIGCKDKEEKGEEGEKIFLAMESNVSNEIYFNKTNRESDVCDVQNSAVCKEQESVISQNSSDVVTMSQPLEENNEQKLQKLDNKAQSAEDSEEPGTDQIDNINIAVISKPSVTLDLDSVCPEEDICDIFMNEKRERNISEFTVIKSIISAEKKQHQECEMKEIPEDCDNIIDSKLLCMDSSDCGLYTEDRCTLTHISEHDFTEEDSMVPMEWETSQIQEDAVNQLCRIDESSIDFASAANSLRGEDNLLLDNLSLSKSIIKEPPILELISEIESKPTESESIVKSVPVNEESKKTAVLSNEECKEQDQVSSSSYEKVAYLHTADCNANTKMIPKFVIKKTEDSSTFNLSKISSPCVPTDDIVNKSILKPKIPKMIIRNARSRPSTPSIEAVPEEASAQTNISDRILPVTHNEMKDEFSYENDSESSLQEPNSYRNKIPKMKIKLDKKHSNKIIKTEDTSELCGKRKKTDIKKIIPKMKIKNSSPKTDLSSNLISNNVISQESKDTEKIYKEKIPILKLKKQEVNKSSSSETMRKRLNSNYSEVPMKKYKKLERDEIEHSSRHNPDSTRTNAPECERNKNSLAYISEKIPKVIIKRTSASAEFKCELSKSYKNVKSAKWQPEVKLERYGVLDSMVKDPKSSRLTPISLKIIDKIFGNHKDTYCRNKENNFDSHKLFRSSSTSNLLPVKCKQRRMSDYDCRRTSTVKDNLNFILSQNTDSKDSKMCNTSKKHMSLRKHDKSNDKYQKDSKRRSRSRDNDLRTKTDITHKKIDRLITGRSNSEKATQNTECKISFVDREQKVTKTEDDMISIKLNPHNILVKQPNSTDFKSALKELKVISNKEECFVKLPSLSETSSGKIDSQTDREQNNEQRDESSLNKDNIDIVTIKQEQLSCSDIDNECTLQDTIILPKDDCTMNILNNIMIDSNSIIKIESSDESQTTIEILPASPDGSELENNMIDDGDSEQLYPADAIPTQFELELEITDNSNIDLLDIPMPKLDPCYNTRHTSTDEYRNDQTSKVEHCDKFELLSRKKNSPGRSKRIEIDTNDNDDRLDNELTDSMKKTSSKSSCSKKSNSTRESYCCNDSLIKEVLAAKEALKKCLSKSRSESNVRPKTAAEKKQGSSLESNNLSETYSKLDDVSYQNCCNDVKLQTDFVSTVINANKCNKTENISNGEKSDKKHSKQSKSTQVKKKLKSPQKKDDDLWSTLTLADSEKTARDTHECTTISLKEFKRFERASLNKKLIPTVNLSEKKKKKNTEDRNDPVPRLRDAQRKEENKLSSYKIPKISRTVDTGIDNPKEIKSKEDNMPILEPQLAVNFDTSLDRDSSRSPPVITNQSHEDIDAIESKLLDDKVIKSDDKVESDMKEVSKKSEISIADFVTQLAYHEKTTIKHRRYCNLCERWFPTTSRHKRHLAGYQHRHIELTQRRSIHALFALFTGKPCPRLLPTNVVRSDCSLGELTPLQIAVQDITKCSDYTQQSPKKQNDVDK